DGVALDALEALELLLELFVAATGHRRPRDRHGLYLTSAPPRRGLVVHLDLRVRPRRIDPGLPRLALLLRQHLLREPVALTRPGLGLRLLAPRRAGPPLLDLGERRHPRRDRRHRFQEHEPHGRLHRW